MLNRITRWMLSRPATMFAGAAALAVSCAALADEAAPQPNLSKAPPAWLGILVMFILLALVISVSLMPSRRSHQD
jgi:hypothetical protein